MDWNLEPIHKNRVSRYQDKRRFDKVSSTAVNKVPKKKTRSTFTIHGLRHIYIHFLIYNNVDVVTISKLVGHKDTTETLKTYTHLFEEKQAQNFDNIRNIWGEFGS